MAISNPVRTGIDYGVDLPGLIPPYLEREAARFALYNWSNWIELDPMERAACVAHYRLSKMVDMHVEDAIARKIKSQSNSGNQGRP